MKTKPFIGITLSTISVVIGALVWYTPITAYRPRCEDEVALQRLFVTYIHARNNRAVDRFLSTLHKDGFQGEAPGHAAEPMDAERRR